MPATLKLVRESIMMELRRGAFDILVDGRNVGSVAMRQTTEVLVEPGHHTVQVRTGRYSSQDQPFEAGEGEVVTFRCNSARIWPLYLASILKPDIGLVLRRL